jgi:hypothetical protein
VNREFLASLGWDPAFEQSFNEESDLWLSPGRIVSQGQGHYRVALGPEVELEA